MLLPYNYANVCPQVPDLSDQKATLELQDILEKMELMVLMVHLVMSELLVPQVSTYNYNNVLF